MMTILKSRIFSWLMALAAAAVTTAYGSSALAAFEKSSKKECALCHVMWLDVFRTDKETLIQWQPGNVLMKDTQGIVSAEKMCYSCHDGYVTDSRFTAWKYHNHPVYKKPSADITIPPSLPLSNKNEIYCGTCHSPHSGREAVPGASPEETIPGPLAFLRLPNIDSSLCETCHTGVADYRHTNGHPLHSDKLAIPATLFARGSVKAAKKGTIICETCHKIHGAEGDHITVVDNTGSQLCMTCHKERTIAGTPHDMRLTLPKAVNSSGQTAAQSGPCGACHGVHRSAGYKLLDKKCPPGNPATQVCLTCHGGAPADRTKTIGRYSHPINIGMKPKGGSTTAEATVIPGLPAFSPNGLQQPAGSIQCFTCHNIHQWDPADADNRGGGKVEGNANNSFLRISAAHSSDLCLACHTDKRQVLSFDHNLIRTAPLAVNNQGATADTAGPCGACHLPHNAVDKHLWAREDATDAKGVPHYCISCHNAEGAAKSKPIGKNDHPVDIPLTAETMSPSRIGGILPLFNDAGGLEGGDRMTCRTCHEPHNWSTVADPAPGTATVPGAPAANPAGSSQNIATPPVTTATPETATVTQTAGLNIEGDARNSFLIKPASPTPQLCVICHPETALLVGTDHDLFVTAPAAQNLFHQTVAQSGQCGVCHGAHNNVGPRLLWAQALGAVDENQHPMDALCLGCHSAGGVAADKVPPVATHPKGKLINNILTFDPSSEGYIRLYDNDWKPVHVGDLACSSCHSFYQWDHRIPRPGTGHNSEGDAETSFLRTSSDKTVCIDCHGETAIWRYLYYHSVAKRALLDSGEPLRDEGDKQQPKESGREK